MQHGCVPATPTMYVNIRAEGRPLYHIRFLEVLVFYLTPIMHSHGVGWVRAQVGALNTVLPIVSSRTSGVPAELESRIRFICRPSVRSYEYAPPCTQEERC